jgi:LCP family protein required for cell wall assembly
MAQSADPSVETPLLASDNAVQRSAIEPQRQLADIAPAESSLLPLSRTKNVLVLGSDRRPNMPNWRTDVIMIVAMNLETGEAGVVSVPRDVYIDLIPDHQPNRINVIDYLGEQDEPDGGGPKLLSQIIEEKMGIPIHHYLRFDFEGFKKVVDALGGLEITLDCPVSDYLPEEDIAIRLQPGTHRLNGKEALAYVRTRRQGGDLERSRRQQRVVWAVRDQIRRENLVSRVPALYAALHDSVQTDISLVSAIRYVRFALALDEEDVHGIVLSPPDMLREGWRGGMFVFVANWDLISEQIQTIFDRPSFLEGNTVGEGTESPRCP